MNHIAPFISKQASIPEQYLRVWARRIRHDLESLEPSVSKKYTPAELRLLVAKVFQLHKSLGHLHFTAIAIGIRDNLFINSGLSYKDVMLIGKHVDCSACAAAKWVYIPPTVGSGIRTDIPFYEVSVDRLGPYKPTAIGGFNYAIVLTCLSTGFARAVLSKECPDSYDYIEFLKGCMLLAIQYGWTIKRIRYDAGSVEKAAILTNFFQLTEL
jgi:hypothetical protein